MGQHLVQDVGEEPCRVRGRRRDPHRDDRVRSYEQGPVALTPDITLASQALSAVHAYVLGSVATQQAARRAEQRTGLSEEQWQRSLGPYISAVLAAGEHPMLARRVHEAEEPDPDAEFAFGLACVLDGLAARAGR
ncbi:TetR/AcrR family transcriptional regulator C-terminal domain-containing protein [Kitasatospora kazusensis]|uniref:TetR/AcrR family transcriptional regulator C-terminal domain-containing protein n=1 Tax=Kitasatospora kazusensis TaxID=407974 RepID=UPI0031E098D0